MEGINMSHNEISISAQGLKLWLKSLTAEEDIKKSERRVKSADKEIVMKKLKQSEF
jgi:hypothetical protein